MVGEAVLEHGRGLEAEHHRFPQFRFLSQKIAEHAPAHELLVDRVGLHMLAIEQQAGRLGVEGLLAHANLTAAIPRLSISVAALSVSLSMMVAIAVMIGSFRDTVIYWVGQTLRADLFIGPGIRPTVGSEQTISEDVIAALSKHPDVVAIDRFRNVDLVYQGNLAVLGSGSYDVVLQQGSLLFKSPADARELCDPHARRRRRPHAVCADAAARRGLASRTRKAEPKPRLFVLPIVSVLFCWLSPSARTAG